MIAVILSAGAGSRLLPLTLERPKCLVEVDGRTILDWQLDAVRQAGIKAAVVVGGYRSPQIAAHLDRHRSSLPVELVFNPFWSLASSIGSVWAARDHLHGAFCLMNGDTIFDPALIRDAAARASAGVNLLVEPLAELIEDDMLVAVENGAVRGVAKSLPRAAATHRSLGVILAGAEGGASYLQALEAVIAAPGGTNAFHHAVIAHLAQETRVGAIVASAATWQEVDSPDDIVRWASRRGGADVAH